MRIAICAVLSAALLVSAYAGGMDWKPLHEKAKVISLSQARADAASAKGSLEAWYVLGLACLDHWENEEALQAFNAMLKLAPGNPQARWGAAEVMRRRHDLKGSAGELDAVIAEAPDYYPAYLSRGYIDYLTMDFNQAVSRALTVMKKGKGTADLDTLVRAHTIYAGAKGMIAHYGGPLSKVVNGTAVLTYLKKAEGMEPDAPSVLFGLGSFYLLSPALAGGDVDKALVYLEKAKARDPNFADIYVRLSQAYKVKGDKAKAKEYMDKALSLDPGNEFAKDALSGQCRFICP